MLRETLLESLRRFPGDLQMIQRLGQDLESSGEWPLLREVLQQQLSHVPTGTPGEAQVTYLLAKACLEMGEERRALALVGRSLLVRPDFAYSHHIQGRALARLQRFPEAIAAQRRCLELAPEFSWGWFELGCLHRQQGQLQTAVVHLKRALSLQTTSDAQHQKLIQQILQEVEDRLRQQERHAAALALWPDRSVPKPGEQLWALDEIELQLEAFRQFLDRVESGEAT